MNDRIALPLAEVGLTRQFRQLGVGPAELAGLVRAGDLVRVRRGAYAHASDDRAAKMAHQRLIAGTLPLLTPNAVLSFGSAGVLYDLPVPHRAIERVHVTKPRPSGGRRDRWIHVHVAVLDPAEIGTVDGIAVTSLARTVCDLSRTVSLTRGVAIADAALASGLCLADLSATVEAAKRRVGAPRARQVVAAADGRAESAGESISRVILDQLGLDPSELQFQVRDQRGRLVARTDFCWEAQRTVGEFDGKIKYGRTLNPGQDIEEVLFEEKLREDAIRDLGWQVVRWTWRDLSTPSVLAARIRRAFLRAR